MAIERVLNNHIIKCVNNHSYNLKCLTMSGLTITSFGHYLDYLNISKNKDIPKDKIEYTKRFKAVYAIISTCTQLFTSFTILNEKFQERLSNKLFKNIKISGDIEKFKKCSNGLKTFCNLFVATMFISQFIMPLITTPLASINKKEKKLLDNLGFKKYNDKVKYLDIKG